VSARFQELDWRETPLGAISLRRRHDPLLDAEVYEVKLDDDWLMSSAFTVAEVDLARLALARVSGQDLRVVVGGLGLGYTALAVLAEPRVASLVVVEALDAVIEWHQRGLVPLGPQLTADPRCTLLHGDFFALAGAAGLDPVAAGLLDAVIVDIDHSPTHLLNRAHASFYQPAGLRLLARQVRPGGVFALWSNDPPDEAFTAVLAGVFVDVRAEVVSFPNPLQQRTATNTVYLATVR
jgi:spermidine synthase